MNFITIGADANKPSQSARIPAGTPLMAVREAFTTDLRNAMLACQKLGIDINRPALRRILLLSGGSAGALAVMVGPQKTQAAINIFTKLGDKYADYIKGVERNVREFARFAASFRRKTGKRLTAKGQANAKVAADMGGIGILLALGAGGAAYFVTKQFANNAVKVDPSIPASYNSDVGPPPSFMPAVPPANPKAPSLVHYNSDLGPPPVTPKTIVKPTNKSSSAGQGEDCRGVEACCNGSLEEIVGAAGPQVRRVRAPQVRRPTIPGQVPAGTIRPVRAPNRAKVRPMQFQPMRLTPGAVSPMRETLDPTTAMLVDMIRNAPSPAHLRTTRPYRTTSRYSKL
jgi:hypothetical protein